MRLRHRYANGSVLILYGVLAFGILVAIGYGVHKVKQWGADEVRAEWAAANLKAQQAADAERKRVQALQQAQDAAATRRLADAQKRSRSLMASLEAHIRASGSAAQCPIPGSLFDAWNASHKAGEGASTGTVPATGRPAAPAN